MPARRFRTFDSCMQLDDVCACPYPLRRRHAVLAPLDWGHRRFVVAAEDLTACSYDHAGMRRRRLL